MYELFVKVFLSWAQTVSSVTRQEQITDWYLKDIMLLNAMAAIERPSCASAVPLLNWACFNYSVVWLLWCSWKVSLSIGWPAFLLLRSVICKGIFLFSMVLAASPSVQLKLPTQENKNRQKTCILTSRETWWVRSRLPVCPLYLALMASSLGYLS